MRIAFLVHGFPPNEVGGVELYTRALVGALRQLGLDCVVLAGSRTSPTTRANLSTSFEDGIPVTRLLNPRRQPVNRAIEGDPEADALVQAFLLQTRPDVVHVQHWVRLSPSLVAISAELGIPAVVTLPDQWTACPRIHRVRPNLHACNAFYSERLCLDCVERDPWQSDEEITRALALRYQLVHKELALAARLLVPTESAADFLSKISGLSRERLLVFPLGWPHATPLAPLSLSDSSQGPLKVGHWGNLHVLKGCHLLLLAAKLLPQTAPLAIHFWGYSENAAYGEYLSTLAEGLDVTFHGKYDPKDLQQADLDLAVFPSLAHETYSFVLDEALALGLPVVVPDRGALAERAGAKGVSFVYGSAVDLSRVLKEVALSTERLRALQRAPAPPIAGLAAHARCLAEIYRSVSEAKEVELVVHPSDPGRNLFLQEQVDERDRHLETLLQGEAELQERAELAEARARVEAEQVERAGLEREREVLAQRLVEGDQQVARLQEQVAEKEQAVQTLGAELAEARVRAEAEQVERAGLEREREVLAQRLVEGDQQVARLREQVAKITSSTAWDLVQALSRMRVALAPLGSRRDRVLRLGIRGFRVWRREGGRALLHKAFRKIRYRLASRSDRPVAVQALGNQLNDHRYSEAYTSGLATAAGYPGKDYVPLAETDFSSEHAPVKAIAFYLPQFHPIPQNDEWWGKGFTEWTMVSKAVPRFLGHYQPHLPGELGFYDLRVPDVQRRQVELAKKYGIYGFCFYYYWFNGKRLLWRPIEQFASDPEIDFPFCLCWANENWTRRWDGLDDEILIAQEHTKESDQTFIKDIEPLLRHKNYIRINGRPLLIVYRVQKIQDPLTTVDMWRKFCEQAGIGGLYLILAQTGPSFPDPREIGFDAAIEFPPHIFFPLNPINHTVEILDPSYEGLVFQYSDVVSLFTDPARQPAYKLFKTVFPAWDNEPRRPGRGHTFAFSTPSIYEQWLTQAGRCALEDPDPERRIVFINAWNEWGEGAHLEPDRRYGYAYLNATVAALSSLRLETLPGRWKVLFVSHDAFAAGAQSVLLEVISWIKKHTLIDIKILCIDGGSLVQQFRELGDTLVLSELKQRGVSEEKIALELQAFCGGSPDLIYGNSLASARAYHFLSCLGAPIITHVHELEMSISQYAALSIDDALKHTSHFIACSKAVQENLVKKHGVNPAEVTIVYGSIHLGAVIQPGDDEEKRERRSRLGLEADKFLIFGCGMGMPFRKGGDLFIEVAGALRRKGFDDFHFYWIGGFDGRESDDRYGPWGDHLAALGGGDLRRYVTFLGIKDNPKEYFLAGDVFLLPSREDPFPLVALEAAECGLPTVCFADAGGAPEFVEGDAGFVVPRNTELMAEKIIALMLDKDLRHRLGVRAREKLLAEFVSEKNVPCLLSACRNVARKMPTISVIVPNYNHAKYLPRRLESIFAQTFKDFEVILLDDASSDSSLEILERYAHRADVRIIRNEGNSGAPFAQWLKGIDLARADILWIAESDDACEPEFLETLIPAFRDPEAKLAYANSHVVDEDGNVTGDYTNSEYLTSLSHTKWQRSYQATATEEINDGLGVKNTILNISAVLFRKFEFDAGFRSTLERMRIAGDWYLTVHAIKGGKVHYEAKKLNYHRRHTESVIGKIIPGKRVQSFFQEFHVVQRAIFENYDLTTDFREKWERYLRKQWNDFFPGRPFEELRNYYPVDQVSRLLTRS